MPSKSSLKKPTPGADIMTKESTVHSDANMPSGTKNSPKIALLADFLTDIGGAESVLFELAKIYPEAPIYTLLFDKKRMEKYIDVSRVHASELTGVPRFMRRNRFRRYLLPLFPRAIEQFDFSKFDIVISSSHSFAKGIITKPQTMHVCYCHSPTRYLWDWHRAYLKEQKLRGLKLFIVEKITSNLRQWDLLASERVDRFFANSKNVQRRIQKYYRRDSDVIYPPVKIPDLKPTKDHAGYFLIVSRIEPNKRIDLAIKAFARMKDLQLVVIGDGWQKKSLEKIATKNIEFLGFKDRATVEAYYHGCRGFIFAGEDDFGITPVEAMAAGKPVVAFGKGGALETVIEGQTGTFFYEPTPKALKEAVIRLIDMERSFNPPAIRKHAEKFSQQVFARKFSNMVAEAYTEHQTKYSQ